MALDYQQVRKQIQELGEKAPQREQELRNLRDTAKKMLSQNAMNQDYLREKIGRAVQFNKNLRCAIPTDDPFTETYPLPDPPKAATIIAADGSQINPDRHLPIDYCLVNVGAIQMQYGMPDPPEPIIQTELFYDETLYGPSGVLTEGMVALIRDQREREVLADLADKVEGPVITFADGPVELWGREELLSQRFDKYLAALSRLHKRGAITAGYVDKPRSDLVIRLLELSTLSDNKMEDAGKDRFLRGIPDIDLFRTLLNPGDRSAIFGIQSKTAESYQENLALHFFYLNVSLDPEEANLVRVEVPAWVADDKGSLNSLHAILVEQCQIVAGAEYPYLLHRAHETAVVTRDEKEQIENMIAVELRRQGVHVGRKSGKQSAKDYSRV